MILIADDDPSVVASLGLLLKRHGHATVGALTQEEALRHLEKEGDEIGLVLQDMNFSRGTSGEEGLELLREIRRRRPQLPVILITAWGSIALAVEGMKAGAADFVTKPWSNPQILQSVDTALSLARSETLSEGKSAPSSREELDRRFDFRGLIGRDPRFLKILELIGRVAPTDASVLITGESGTGKELVAEALHRNSRRQGGPFVKVNLGGISSTLFESEMFGHVRGAFTDARADRKGRFELAHGGTIFLDEIGEIDPSAQVKLLRVLQDRSYEVLGSSITRTVDVRVIAATNRDLGEQVAKGQFREDLLYRLNLIAIRLPPLRERRGDVPLLARHFLDASSQVYRRGEAVVLSDRARDWLQSQSWPGNIRQLKQTLERAVLVLDGDVLEVDDLLALSDLETRAARDPNALPSPGSMTLDQMEKAMIVKCLRHYEGNVTRVAEALGLSRAALYRRFEKYGLEP
jgi:DNA-binding NtrC family response regulator